MANILNTSHFFGAWIDLPFIIFVCSLYRPWVTIRLLHHFGFVCALILGYAVCIFHAIYWLSDWRKIRNVSRQLTQISKREHNPCYIIERVLHSLWLHSHHLYNSAFGILKNPFYNKRPSDEGRELCHFLQYCVDAQISEIHWLVKKNNSFSSSTGLTFSG